MNQEEQELEQGEEVEREEEEEVAPQRAMEASRRDQDAHWKGMEEALALSAAGDSIHALLCDPPPPSPPRPIVEPKAEREPMPTQKRSPPSPTWPEESYTWTAEFHKWVSAPPVHYAATPKEEEAHLEC